MSIFEFMYGCLIVVVMSLFFLEDAEEAVMGLVYESGLSSRDEFI